MLASFLACLVISGWSLFACQKLLPLTTRRLQFRVLAQWGHRRREGGGGVNSGGCFGKVGLWGGCLQGLLFVVL